MPKQNKLNKTKKSILALVNSETVNSETDMDFLDKCIAENKQLGLEQKKIDKSPLEKNIDEAKKNANKEKLHNAIYMKYQKRGAPPKKEIETQENLLKEMMKHPKMTTEILNLYGKAIAYNPSKTLPNPVEIFDNDEKYRIEYYQYILGIIDNMKQQKKDIKFLSKILDNPYGHYMSKCLNCLLNPFDKINMNRENNTVIDSSTETVIDSSTETVIDSSTETVIDSSTETVIDSSTETSTEDNSNINI